MTEELDAKVKPMPLRSCSGNPIPNDFCEQVERVMADARLGKVTSFAWCAVGPEFARWENAHMAGRQDRINLIGQLAILQQQMIDKEVNSA